jgi:hypothetical protein
MSAQTMAEVFAPAEERYRIQVQEDTFGHLAPKKNTTYRGHVIFAIGCYDCGELNPTPLSVEFGDLPDSPWFYDALIDLLSEDQGVDKQRFAAGHVYRFDGSFRDYVFRGKFRECEVK